MFGLKPRNIDDCLKHSETEKPLKVSLTLDTDDADFNDETGVTRTFMQGEFEWEFPNNIKVNYKHNLYGFLNVESEDKRRASIDTANSRLIQYLQRITNQGIDVENAEQRFDYSLATKP